MITITKFILQPTLVPPTLLQLTLITPFTVAVGLEKKQSN